jgi:succinate dehydrogenase/fumarate reductase-like Fe-S protein
MEALAAGRDAAVQMIDTSVVRVHQHGACIAGNNHQEMGRRCEPQLWMRPGDVCEVETVEHLDRCLTCLACAAICPSGIQYSKLIGHGLEHVEATIVDPFCDGGLGAL